MKAFPSQLLSQSVHWRISFRSQPTDLGEKFCHSPDYDNLKGNKVDGRSQGEVNKKSREDLIQEISES